MFIFFMDSQGMILQHRVPDGQTVTAAYYLNVIAFFAFHLKFIGLHFFYNGRGTDVPVLNIQNWVILWLRFAFSGPEVRSRKCNKKTPKYGSWESNLTPG